MCQNWYLILVGMEGRTLVYISTMILSSRWMCVWWALRREMVMEPLFKDLGLSHPAAVSSTMQPLDGLDIYWEYSWIYWWLGWVQMNNNNNHNQRQRVQWNRGPKDNLSIDPGIRRLYSVLLFLKPFQFKGWRSLKEYYLPKLVVTLC